MTNKLIEEIEVLLIQELLKCYGVEASVINSFGIKVLEAIRKHQPEPQGLNMITLQKIGAEMHYPDCWDTTAYPTIFHAIYEIANCGECQPEPQQAFEDDLTKGDASTRENEAVLQFTASTSPTNTTELEKIRDALEATIREFSLADEYVNKVFDENISNSAVTKTKHALTIINRMLGKGE